MLRQQIRLRKEYLYKKAKQDDESKKTQQSRDIGRILEKKSGLNSSTRQYIQDNEMAHFYDQGLETPSNFDDEYREAGLKDPRILITTSRDPSSRLTSFAKELKLLFPNSLRINRGNHVLSSVVDLCRTNDISDLVMLHEHRGVPSGLTVSHFPHGPTAYFSLFNVSLRHDIVENLPTVSEAYPHLIINNFSTKLGKRVSSILKYLFPVPKADSKRVITLSNKDDFISLRHHVFDSITDKVELTEVGPRFDLKLYEIRLGLVDFENADKEWILHAFTNSAKKKTYL